MTNIGAQIFAIGCMAAKTLAGITNDSTGCPVCHSDRAMRVNFFSEGIWHKYKTDKYSAQFDTGNYICENGHEFSVDDEGKLI